MRALTNPLRRWISTLAGWYCAVALCAATVPLRGADEGKSSPARPAASSAESIDEQLMRDLDNELLESARSSREKPANTRPPGGQHGADGANTGEDIGQAGEEDPLLRIAQEMRSVEKLIDRHGAAQRAETMQQRIVVDLALLIQQLEAQAKQSMSQSQAAQQQTSQREKTLPPDQSGRPATSQHANNPAKGSTTQVGKNATKQSDLKAAQELMKSLWGHLPAHAREEMLQHSPEQFLPQYEVLIEKYYKRLAEQQRASP